MTTDPLVTIVTPSYNHGQFIRSTIESILSQDYPNLEYIVMDGGSTDETASVVRDYASRLTFVSGKDRGQSHAINKGFERGKGEILAWMNSDDVYLPGAISTAVRAFAANPDCGMVYGEGNTMDREGKVLGRFPHSRPFNLWRLVYLSDFILQQSAFFRRSVLDEIGYLDEDAHYGMDWDLFIRIGLKYPVCYIPEYLGCIREYAGTKSSRGALERAHELHRILRKHTGMWLPPGSVVYAGEAYWRHWQSWLDSRMPRAVARFGRSALQLGARLVIGRTIQHAQGLYDDGWAANKLRCMLPAGKGSFLIAGSVPGWALGQQFVITANGVPLGRHSIPGGDFDLRVTVPDELAAQPLHLEIRSSRYLRRAIGTDRRALAFLFNEIRWD